MRPRRSTAVAAVCTAFFGLFLASALAGEPARAASVHYLSPNGSDDNAGSADSPWATFDYALRQLEPGDVLTVRGGEYRERLLNPSLVPGTPGSPIRVQAYPGETPVIRGVLWIRGMNYWTFSGINVTWDSATGDDDEHMVKLTNGVGWRISNAEISGAESFAAVLVASTTSGEPRDWMIDNNCIHDTHPTNGTNQDHLIYVNSGLAGGGTVSGNLLFNAPNGNGIKLGGPSERADGTHGIRIVHNTIVNTSQSVLVAWSSSNNELTGNLVFGVGSSNGNLRAFELTGTNNFASSNAGGGSSALFTSDQGFGVIHDDGTNLWPVDPQFVGEPSCDGFLPGNPVAAQYGHAAFIGSNHNAYFDDIAASSHATAINTIAALGVTQGCAHRLYCPHEPVTRAQMASFLARALQLEPTNQTFFDDIAASSHASAINTIAALGVTEGCAHRLYCPHEPVTRAQMASFLARALQLEPTNQTFFDDIASSPHASAINTIAVAGVTQGCAPRLYCPNDPVTRAQMATFLSNALQLGS